MCVRLVHPNIMRVHECLVAEDGCPYLVMDLLDGVPLSAYTRDGGRVAVSHAVPVLQGMLAGLEAAHGQGVVHRDLKPANVFLERTGGTFSVRLLDFGIAKVMDVAGGMGNRTRTGMLLGTPAYMSPEQITNAKDVDGRADLWSAGVMFYEMLTGRSAFPAPTEYARLSAVLQVEPEPLEKVDPTLASLAEFVGRALKKDRAHRFQSAAEMASALATATRDSANSRVSQVPLSRLPDRPWLNAGNTAAGNTPVVTTPVASTPLPTTKQPISIVPPTPILIEEVTRLDPAQMQQQSPGGTLASLTPAPTMTPRAEVNVILVKAPEGATGGTLTSQASRVPKRRGVALGWVVALVVAALVVGLAGGFALGRAF